MCLLCDHAGKKVCEHQDKARLIKQIEPTEYAGGDYFHEYVYIYHHEPRTTIYGMMKSEADILGNQYEPKPGTGVTVKDGLDQNHQRDGFVRGREGEYYNIFFEPGEKDGKYRRDQFETNGHSIDPKKIPDPKK